VTRILVTGSSGLIGSEVSSYFHARGCCIHGLDNNQRAAFFGPNGDTETSTTTSSTSATGQASWTWCHT
jgi:nucleoside-diphosphate-sugar epimerase